MKNPIEPHRPIPRPAFRLPGNLLTFIVLIFCSIAQAEQALVVRVSKYTPYVFFNDATQEWDGLSIDILKALGNRTGYTFEYRKLPRDRAFIMMKNGEIDIMLNLTQTPEREEFLDFIGLSGYEQMSLIVRKENVEVPITSLDDFITLNKKIAIVDSYHYPVLTDRMKKDVALKNQMIISNGTIRGAFARQVSRGAIFGFFENKTTLSYRLKNHPEYRELALHGFSLNEPHIVHVAVSRKTDATVRNKLREAHKKLTEEGHIERLVEKWGG